MALYILSFVSGILPVALAEANYVPDTAASLAPAQFLTKTVVTTYLLIGVAAVIYFSVEIRRWFCINFFTLAIMYPLAFLVNVYCPAISPYLAELSSPLLHSSYPLWGLSTTGCWPVFYILAICALALNTKLVRVWCWLCVYTLVKIFCVFLMHIFQRKPATAAAVSLSCPNSLPL
jgi:hypothetical protein